MSKKLSAVLMTVLSMQLSAGPLMDREAFDNSNSVTEWFDKMEDVDLGASDMIIELGGSTSCNFHAYKKDASDTTDGMKKIGKFIPENPAGNPNTEVAYFNFGRMVGAPSVYQKAVSYVADKNAVAKFLKTMSNSKVGAAQRKNCEYLKSKMTKDSSKLEGALKDKFSGEKKDLNKDYYTSSGINQSKKVPQFLKQGTVKPTEKLMSLDTKLLSSEYKGVEKELAHQLFHIFIADILFGQYDRWSGSNFIVKYKPESKEVSFFAADNGGTYMIAGYTTQHLKAIKENWFSRYYKPTMDKLVALNSFLNDKSSEFEGFKDKIEFAKALGFKFSQMNGSDAPAKSTEHQLGVFKTNLGKLLEKYNADVAVAKKKGKEEDAYLPLVD
jgi:hypothetical protein